jgi:hypothetical protein
MPAGPGKYTAECARARIQAQADTAILLILGGRLGNGFEVQTVNHDAQADLPALLRSLADQIEGAPVR